MDVLVSLTAPPGALAAVASDATGSNHGPGAIMITPAPNVPVIILDEPHDAVFATEQTAFTWHESQQGIATFFLFQLTDEDGKLMFSAQTTKTLFAITAADLDILAVKATKRVLWSVHGIANKTEVVEMSEQRPVFLTAHR